MANERQVSNPGYLNKTLPFRNNCRKEKFARYTRMMGLYKQGSNGTDASGGGG
jgi:hypothetical protein